MSFDRVIKINLDITSTKTEGIATDEQLISEVISGDEAAFNLIFERYKKLVAHLAGRFFNEREVVEDCIQQSFVKAYFSLKDFRGGHEKSFSSWLSRLAVNICYDELRRRQRKPEDAFSGLGSEEIDYLENFPSRESGKDEKAMINRDLAEKLLSSLDPKDRLAITLYHGEEFSVSEVAKTLGWSESNVKTRLMRVRHRLRILLEKLS